MKGIVKSDRLLYPLKRTRPKGDPDPGWERISWDGALDLTAARLRQIAAEDGPESVVFAELCRNYSPDKVEAICGVAREQIENAARLLWEARPVAYYAWSGVEMQTNATQIARAIAQLYTLTGSLDAAGGNVLFASAPTGNVGGAELLPAEQRVRALGLQERPLGPSRWGFVTSDELYRGILEQQPYPVRGLVGFGANLLMAHADGARGREALTKLDFYVHADLFMNPTAELNVPRVRGNQAHLPDLHAHM